jgi:hypothetical protein
MNQPTSPTKAHFLCTDSDYMTYITSTFYAFLNVVILYIKTLNNNMKKILHFRDAAASQYNSWKMLPI